MIDLTTEQLLKLKAVGALPVFKHGPDAKNLHASTVWRWVTRDVLSAGGTRIRLQTIRLPGGTYSSREAVDRFIAKLNDRSVGEPSSVDVSRVLPSNAKKVSAFLDSQGL